MNKIINGKYIYLNYTEVKVKTIYVDKDQGMKIKDGLKAILLMFKWRLKLK